MKYLNGQYVCESFDDVDHGDILYHWSTDRNARAEIIFLTDGSGLDIVYLDINGYEIDDIESIAPNEMGDIDWSQWAITHKEKGPQLGTADPTPRTITKQMLLELCIAAYTEGYGQGWNKVAVAAESIEQTLKDLIKKELL